MLQTIDAMVKEVGADKVGIRLSPYNWEFQDCHEPDVESTIELNAYLLKELNRYNLAYAHIVTARAAGEHQESTIFTGTEVLVIHLF